MQYCSTIHGGGIQVAGMTMSVWASLHVVGYCSTLVVVVVVCVLIVWDRGGGGITVMAVAGVSV